MSSTPYLRSLFIPFIPLKRYSTTNIIKHLSFYKTNSSINTTNTINTQRSFYSTSVDKSHDTHNNLDPFEDKCFQGQVDHFNGVIVKNDLPESPQIFDEMLTHSLGLWKKNGRRGIWLKIPQEKSQLIPIAVKHGFNFHHAHKGFLVLTSWLSSEMNKLPDWATTTLGVGGAVLDDKRNILLVTEKHSPTIWKVPGGRLDFKEDIPVGVAREVFEETGIKCTFKKILGFRHLLSGLMGSNDIYFICVLKASSHNITIDPGEISQAKWAPLDEFYNLTDTSPVQRSVARLLQQYEKNENIGFTSVEIGNFFSADNSLLWHGSNGHFTDLKKTPT